MSPEVENFYAINFFPEVSTVKEMLTMAAMIETAIKTQAEPAAFASNNACPTNGVTIPPTRAHMKPVARPAARRSVENICSNHKATNKTYT